MIDWFLLLAIGVDSWIMARIFGELMGALIVKLLRCAVGFQVDFVNHDTGVTHTEHFRWKEAWTALGDFERIRRYHRDNQALGR